MANSNISGGKIELRLKQWVCDTPFIRTIFTNPFIISILILSIVWLLDILYGKTFESSSSREIIQHSTTVLFVMIAGIFLNNLALIKCNQVNGGSHEELSHSHHEDDDLEVTEPQVSFNKYDEVLSRYE